MMKTIKISFIFFVIAIGNLSCSNDDDNPTPEPTVKELLNSGRWYAESQTDFPMNDCYKHSNYRFLANDNFVAEIYGDDSGTCEITNTLSGTWELLTDTEMNITFETTTSTYTIVTISENELVLNWMSGGDSITTIFDKNPGNG